MEDQGKRLLIAVAIAFAIMLVWNMLFPTAPPEENAKQDARPPAADSQATTSSSPTPGSPAPGAVPNKPGEGAPAARGAEQTFVLETPEVRAEFSSWGGVLAGWKLLGRQFHQPGRDMPEDLVRLNDKAHRSFLISFSDGSTHMIPPDAEWRGEKKGPSELVFTWNSDNLSVEKRYRVRPGNYVLEFDVAIDLHRGSAKQGLIVSLFSEQDPRTKEDGGWSQQPREWKAACYVADELHTWDAPGVEKRPDERGRVLWGGYLHSYFLAALAPRTDASNLGCRAYPVSTQPGGMGLDLLFPLTQIDAGQQGQRLETRFVGYFGPKYLEKLEAVPAIVGMSPGFEKAVDLGFWGFLAGPMLWLLEWFYGFVASWGIAIVLLTVTVKLATLYWTHKSMKSMKEMSRLRPQLDKLRDKYKDDRQKQQVETMNLFKAHGVNPLAGCLPMLLQMPIWFALYRALSVAGELYQAEFLWIEDLTAADPYFILPVFMTATMLLQGRLTPTTGTGMQQKMLAYGMPAMFGAMSLFFPAGLTLYISTNTVLTLLHHLYMKRSGDGPAVPAVKEPAGQSPKEASRSEAEDVGEGEENGKGASEMVRNGQRPRGPKGSRPGRRGGRRKRSSRSS